MSLATLTRERRVLICVGSGGVGKTTIAAALALAGARAGRRAVVVTIDPARRLAAALGLDALDDMPRPVDLTRLVPEGPRASGGQDERSATPTPPRGHLPEGTLAATMLDQRAAWAHLVEQHVESDAARRRLVDNTFYRHLTESFAGSHEFLAVERLCALVEDPAWDLIVLDTPPTRHALDFFEAPERILGFLDPRLLGWLLRPVRSVRSGDPPPPRGRGWAGRRAAALLARLEEATGSELVPQLSDFFAAVSALFETFAARARRAAEILRAPETALIVVAGPHADEITQAEDFYRAMLARRLQPAAVVVNRVHPASLAAPAVLDEPALARARETLRATLPAGTPHLDWIAENFFDHQREARVHASSLGRLRAFLPPSVPIAALPDLDADLQTPGGLAHLGRILTA